MRSLFLAMGGALLASAACAEPLTLSAAVAEARASAPDVLAQAQQVEAARAAVIPAGALPDPRASVGATNFPISGPLAGRPDRDNFSMAVFGVSQEVPNSAKRRARVEQAKARVGVAQSGLTLAQREAGTAAGEAWVALYYAERKLAALGDLQRELTQELDTAPARLRAGAARPAATVEPQQRLAALDDRREALRAQALQARAALGRWIENAAAVEPGGPPPPLEVDAATLRANLDELPAMRLAEAKVRQAQAAAGEAKAEKRSDWGYSVQYAHRDPLFGDYISGQVSFTLPVFAKTRQDPEIASRLAEVNSNLAEQEATRRDLRAALDSALAEQTLDLSELKRARETLLPLAQRRAELEKASYQAGAASLSDLLAARRAEVEAELDVLDREAEAARQAVDLNLTYGEDPQ